MTHHPKAVWCDEAACPEPHDPACEHDPLCSGGGWAHEALLTLSERKELGLSEEGEISMAHAKRIMRAYRKGWSDGFARGFESASALPEVSVQEAEDTDAVE